MQIKYLGHSSFLADFGGSRIVIDPFIRPNPLANSINLDELLPDYVLLTHGHADHVTDAKELSNQKNAPIVSNYEVTSWFEKQSCPTIGMNIGGKTKLNFGTIKLVSSTHSSSMPDGSYGGNPVGFVIMPENGPVFYHAGDTALHSDFKIIPLTCPKLDFAILPMGDFFTMGYEDALIAAQWLECNTIIACHFDTFGLIALDKDKAKSLFNKHNINLIIPKIGQIMEF